MISSSDRKTSDVKKKNPRGKKTSTTCRSLDPPKGFRTDPGGRDPVRLFKLRPRSSLFQPGRPCSLCNCICNDLKAARMRGGMRLALGGGGSLVGNDENILSERMMSKGFLHICRGDDYWFKRTIKYQTKYKIQLILLFNCSLFPLTVLQAVQDKFTRETKQIQIRLNGCARQNVQMCYFTW